MALAENVAAYLTDLDDQIAACRAWGHEWPSRKLVPGKPLPGDYHPRLIDDGYIEVTEACMNHCGKRRWYLLFPGGVYDLEGIRRYRDPRNWKVIPREAGITRRQIQGEVIRRVHEDIVAAAVSATAREAKAAKDEAARTVRTALAAKAATQQAEAASTAGNAAGIPVFRGVSAGAPAAPVTSETGPDTIPDVVFKAGDADA